MFLTTNFLKKKIKKMFNELYKKWWCFFKDCSWYKTKMTPEQHLVHMIKQHGMKPPEGFVMPINKNNNKNKKKKKKR